MIRKVIFAVLAVLFTASGIQAQVTRADLLDGIRRRSIFVDRVRFPDTTLILFLNDEEINLAVQGRAIQKESVVVPEEDSSKGCPVPSDFYIPFAAILNADPDQPVGGDNRQSALTYVPYEKFGMIYSYDAGRIEQYSFWGDSIYFNRVSTTGLDTIFLKYIAYPGGFADADSNMTLPKEYKDLLIDRVVLKCFNRLAVQPPSQEDIKNDMARLEINVLGRPADDQRAGDGFFNK